MRIAFFVDSYKPDLSGMVVSVETFARNLRALGHRVFVFAPRMGGYFDLERDVFRVPSMRAPLRNLRGYYLMRPQVMHERRLLESLQPDIVHTHTPFTAGILGDRLAKRLGIPLFTTYHTLLTEYCHYLPLPQDALKSAAVRASRWFCNRCDGVVAPSRNIKLLLEGYGVQRPIRVIPTGVELPCLEQYDRAAVRDSLGIPRDAVVLLYVGRVAKEKNLPFLFEVYRRVFDAHPGAWALIVGGGPEMESLKALARSRGIAERTVFTGMVPKAETTRLYAGADIFTFASVTETQGLVVAEALASALPVVAVRAMGVADMVREGTDGFLCPPEVDDFAERVLFLLGNPQARNDMAFQARTGADRFSCRATALNLEQFYRDILATYPERRHRRRRV